MTRPRADRDPITERQWMPSPELWCEERPVMTVGHWLLVVTFLTGVVAGAIACAVLK